MFRSSVLPIALLSLVASVPALAQEKVANPEYEAWSKYSVDTWVTLRMEMTSDQMKMVMNQTQKLVELSPEKAVIEMEMTMEGAGMPGPMPTQRREIPAQVPPSEAERPAADAATQDITVDGHTYHCKQMTMTTPEGDATAWICEEVPGGIVKVESTSPMGQMTMILVKFEAK